MDDLLTVAAEHASSSGIIFLIGLAWLERIRRDLRHIGRRLEKVEKKLGINDDSTPPGASPAIAA